MTEQSEELIDEIPGDFFNNGLTSALCPLGLVRPMTCYTVLPKLTPLSVYHRIFSTAGHTISLCQCHSHYRGVCHSEQRMIRTRCVTTSHFGSAWTAEQLEH